MEKYSLTFSLTQKLVHYHPSGSHLLKQLVETRKKLGAEKPIKEPVELYVYFLAMFRHPMLNLTQDRIDWVSGNKADVMELVSGNPSSQ